MSRVLIPIEATWYHELKAVGYYRESYLEREIQQHVNSLFPDFYVFPFKASVTSRTTGQTNKPDLAMVRRDFRAWGVIEVELSEHDVRHVLEQTRCFADGNYNAPEIAEYVNRQMFRHCGINVKINRLRKLIGSELPTVLVIADADEADWQEQLRAAGIDLCIFQIFKSAHGTHIYRAHGDYPVVPAKVAQCRRHPSLPNMLEIIGNFEFKKLPRHNQIDIVFNSTLTRWAVVTDEKKNRYLQFIGKANPLSPNATYCLFSDSGHKYYFKIN